MRRTLIIFFQALTFLPSGDLRDTGASGTTSHETSDFLRLKLADICLGRGMENSLKSRFDPEMTEVAVRCLATILTPSLGGIVLLMLPVVNLIKVSVTRRTTVREGVNGVDDFYDIYG